MEKEKSTGRSSGRGAVGMVGRTGGGAGSGSAGSGGGGGGDSGSGSYRHVLRDRRLAALILGTMVSRAGDGMLVVALPVEALRIRGATSAPEALAVVGAAPLVLAVVLSGAAGLGRRRFPVRATVVTDSVLRCVTLAVLGALMLVGGLGVWTLAVALCVGSALQVLGNSGRRLLATGMAGEGELLAVNGLLALTGSVAATVVGPAIGGAAVGLLGPSFVFVLDAATFVVLLAVVLVAVPRGVGDRGSAEARAAGPAGAGRGGAGRAGAGADGALPGGGVPGRRARSGWEILRAQPVAARLFVVVFFFNFFYGPVEVALPILVRGPLHAGAAALGEVWSCFGAGAVVGGLLTNRLRHYRQTTVAVVIVAGWGGSVVLLAAAPDVAVAATAFFVGGLVYAPFIPIVYSLVQSALASDEQQPVITLWSAGAVVAIPMGFALGGPMVGLLGERGGLLVSAALTLALAPIAAFSLHGRARGGGPTRAAAT